LKIKKEEMNLRWLIVLLLIVFIACQKDDGTAYDATSTDDLKQLNSLEFIGTPLKGWELYSWNEKNVWNFSLLPGTNRVKTYSEVTSINTELDENSKITAIRVKGIEAIKLVISKLEEGANITWLGNDWLKRCWRDDSRNLCLPDSSTQADLKSICKDYDVILWITE
jgi:hypothetical protein